MSGDEEKELSGDQIKLHRDLWLFKLVSETANFDRDAMLEKAGACFANGKVKLKLKGYRYTSKDSDCNVTTLNETLAKCGGDDLPATWEDWKTKARKQLGLCCVACTFEKCQNVPKKQAAIERHGGPAPDSHKLHAPPSIHDTGAAAQGWGAVTARRRRV